MLLSIISGIGLRGFLMAGAVAAVAFLAWDYRATKSALEESRLELSAEREARRFSDQARKVAIQEADRQAERAETVKARTIVIRKRPDGNEIAADILLDTISGLRGEEGPVQASTD